MFSLFYLLVKTTKRDFGNIKHAEIKQVLSFKQVSVTLSNFLNRKNKKQEKNRFQNLPKFLDEVKTHSRFDFCPKFGKFYL